MQTGLDFLAVSCGLDLLFHQSNQEMSNRLSVWWLWFGSLERSRSISLCVMPPFEPDTAFKMSQSDMSACVALLFGTP